MKFSSLPGRSLVALIWSLTVLGHSSLSVAQGTPSKIYQGNSTTTRVSSFGYDPNTGLLLSERIEPNTPDLCVETVHAYDGFGNKTGTTVRNCPGASASASFETRANTTTYLATAQGGITQPAGTADGMFATKAVNALGHEEYRRFDPRFGVITQLRGPNGSDGKLDTTWEYDGFGRKVLERRADGSTTRTWYCDVPTDATPLATFKANTNGRAVKEHPGLGDCATIASGLMGAGTPGEVLHTSGLGRFEHTQSYLPNSSVVAGPFRRILFDKLGREVRVVTQAFDGGSIATPSGAVLGSVTRGKLIVVDKHFADTGASVATTQPYFWDTKRSVVDTDAAQSQYGYSYTEFDVIGRPIAVYEASALSTNAVDLVDMPVGRPATLPARKALRTVYQYDKLKTTLSGYKDGVAQLDVQEKNPEGKVIRTTDAAGAQQVFEYDAQGNLVRTFDAMGSASGSSFADANVVAIDYDVRGRKVAMNDPNKGVWRYEYNALGELTRQTESRGHATRLSYDKLGRVISRDAPDHFARFFFDTNPDGSKCASAVSSKGLLCASTTQREGGSLAGVVQRYRVYDQLLRPVSDSSRIYGNAGALERRFETSLAYNTSTGRLQSQTYPTGYAVGYEYSSLGFLNKAGDWNGTAISTVRWTAGVVNAWGKSEGYTAGNGVIQRARYEPETGRIQKAAAGNASADTVFSHTYTWDTLNNLISRVDRYCGTNCGTNENYYYDSLNRLTKYQVAGAQAKVVELSYNAIGSILSRSDVGYYQYRSSGSNLPHAVYAVRGTLNSDYTYDVAGNMQTASGGAYKEVGYNSFNQPDATTGILGRNGTRYTYTYDDNQQRLTERRTTATGVMRLTYKLHPDNAGALGFEQEREAGVISNRHYLSAGGVTVGMVVTTGEIYAAGAEASGAPQASAKVVARVEFWHKDHLGSIVALTDAAGNVRARYAYDPWGQRRNADGSFNNLAPGDYPNGTDRGFTGHEHLDDVGIIHMNGRLYDPVLGRFLQADPFVQSPYDMQNYNAYGYCFNNPGGCTDPTGQKFLPGLVKHFERMVNALVRLSYELSMLKHMGVSYKDYRVAASIATAVVLGPGGPMALFGPASAFANSVVAGFASGMVGSGTVKGGLQGAASAALFYGAGQLATSSAGSGLSATRVAAHAVAGCINAEISGGDCGKGALTAGVNKFLSAQLPSNMDRVSGSIANAVIGGTVSVIGGGKFSNGAVTSAFQYLLNQAVEDAMKEMKSAAATFKDAMQKMFPTPRQMAILTLESVSGVKLPAEAQGAGAISLTLAERGIGISLGQVVAADTQGNAIWLDQICGLAGPIKGYSVEYGLQTSIATVSPSGWDVSLVGAAAALRGGAEANLSYGSDGWTPSVVKAHGNLKGGAVKICHTTSPGAR